MSREGVIKFRAEHRRSRLEPRRYGEAFCALTAWREILALTGLVGQEPSRYGGYGFGNVSLRVGPPSRPRGQRSFLITGTQTSGVHKPTLDNFCVVDRYDIGQNRVESFGSALPSSESLTHAAVYDLGVHIRCVLHAHSPVVWRAAEALRLPRTSAQVEYGTPEMAREVRRLFETTALAEIGLFAMGGHEDGIVAFGRSPEDAGRVLIACLAKAYGTCCQP